MPKTQGNTKKSVVKSTTGSNKNIVEAKSRTGARRVYKLQKNGIVITAHDCLTYRSGEGKNKGEIDFIDFEDGPFIGVGQVIDVFDTKLQVTKITPTLSPKQTSIRYLLEVKSKIIDTAAMPVVMEEDVVVVDDERLKLIKEIQTWDEENHPKGIFIRIRDLFSITQ